MDVQDRLGGTGDQDLAVEAEFAAGVAKLGDRHEIAVAVAVKLDPPRFRCDDQPFEQQLLIVVFARTQHHPVLAQTNRPNVAIASDVPDPQHLHHLRLMIGQDQGEASRCLSPDDPSPVIVHNPGARAPFLLICDHAGRRIPRRLGDLGLSAADLVRHIAWDIGAAGLARWLADLLEAELVLQAYSRLVADCNRDPASADVAPDVSDGSPIPGNAYLDEALLRARINEIHVPYHAAIAAALDLKGRRTALVSIHSFTPQMQRVARPWHVGVLHEQDSPASDRMLEVLTKSGDFVVGDNQPYAMNGQDYTIPLHTKGRGIDYLELEIRQDLILDDQGQARMARWLAPLVSSALAVG